MVEIQNNQKIKTNNAIIIGGGIAGIYTAILLQEKGYIVSLIEQRKFLGGRTYSVKKSLQSQYDNGQHLLMGCYQNLLQFFKKIGSLSKINFQDSFSVKIIDKTGTTGIIRDTKFLPFGLMLLISILKYPYIGFQEKLSVIFTLVKMKFINRKKPKYQSFSFSEWLEDNGQSKNVIEKFWDLVILPTLNDHVSNVSADMGFMVFQESVLRGNRYVKLGFPKGTLDEVIAIPGSKFIENNGGNIYLGNSVIKLLYEDNKISTVELRDGTKLSADIIISAIPSNSLYNILPDELQSHKSFSILPKIEHASIVNIHIWLNTKIMNDQFINIIDSPLQWIFNKSLQDNKYQALDISISDSKNLLQKTTAEIIDLVFSELKDIFPGFNINFVEKYKIIKERKATFRCTPNSKKYRLTNISPVDNLYIAGDWVDTGWPSTMESAALSASNVVNEIESNNKNK